jgi:mannan endo-1,4-beta-mannosidase
MKYKYFSFSCVLILFTAGLFSACTSSSPEKWQRGTPIDAMATDETKALYYNLKDISGKSILFGQQDGLSYGVGRNPAEGCSDVKDVCGSYPAINGWDIGHILDSVNVDGVSFQKMIRLIREAYARGSVNTISWHERNPLTMKNAWDVTPVVARLLPGGDRHKDLTKRLDLMGAFFNALKDDQGKPIPIIFRPYHEHNGDWFWWGKGPCNEQDYIALWRFTVEYLRDSLHIHQLLYASSPDRSRMKTADNPLDFLYAYPGDEYVDILGLDDYWDLGAAETYNKLITRPMQDSLFICSLRTLTSIASEKDKICALTETGMNKLREPDWFTKRILVPVKNDSLARRIAWFLVWRNADTSQFYAPYPGHASAQDFIQFKSDGLILFEDGLPDMYKGKH